MHRYFRLLVAYSALVLSAAACGDREQSAALDSALASDLALAQGSATDVVFADTAVGAAPAPAAVTPATRPSPRPVTRPAASTPSPRPRTPEPTPEPEPEPRPAPTPAPAPLGPGIAAGTSLALSTGDQVCTDNRPGDKIIATLGEPVTASNGMVIPAGAKVVLEVVSTQRGGEGTEPRIDFRVRAIMAEGRSYPANVTVASTQKLEPVRRSGEGSDKKKIIGGAVLGAIAGQVLGKDTKSTVIGAAAGAAAGTAVAMKASHTEGCLPAGSALAVTLQDRLELASR